MFYCYRHVILMIFFFQIGVPRSRLVGFEKGARDDRSKLTESCANRLGLLCRDGSVVKRLAGIGTYV